MNNFLIVCAFLFYGVFGLKNAQAHLMVEQHGTLKLGKGGYFFVLSIPVGSIPKADDNGDGLLSKEEFHSHYNTLLEEVEKRYQLTSTSKGAMVMEGLILNISHTHETKDQPASHVIAMGRFNVEEDVQDLVLSTTLFGKKTEEQAFQISITRGTDKEKTVLRVDKSSHALFQKK